MTKFFKSSVKKVFKTAIAKFFDIIIAAKNNRIIFELFEKKNKKNTNTENIELNKIFLNQKIKKLRKTFSDYISQILYYKIFSSNYYKSLLNNFFCINILIQKKSKKISIYNKKKPRFLIVSKIFNFDSNKAILYISEAFVQSRTNLFEILQISFLNNS